MFNCRRNSLRSIHAASKTNHLSSISYNQTIEPHLFTKNALHKQDYDSLTTQLLEENVPYDTVIAALKKVAENSLFENN